MGLNPGRKNRNLADMSDYEPEVYHPPPAKDCEIDEYTFVINGPLRGHFRAHHYQGKVVDFSFSLVHDQHIRNDGNLVRADCDHGCVHRHRYLKDGSDVLGGHTGKDVISIPPGPDGYNLVHQQYDEQYAWVFENVDQHLERWRSS